MKNFDEEDDDEILKFSWTGMFAVTAVCTFIFSFFLYLIDGQNISTFLSIGAIASICAFLAYMNNYHNRKMARKRSAKGNSFFTDN